MTYCVLLSISIDVKIYSICIALKSIIQNRSIKSIDFEMLNETPILSYSRGITHQFHIGIPNEFEDTFDFKIASIAKCGFFNFFSRK